MMNESTIIANIKSRLFDLGYDQATIESYFKTPDGIGIDLVILEKSKPKVALEVKAGISLPESNDWVGIRFHPAVRQAQRLAREIGAPYYAISDGERILWFETDITGRPKLLTSAILPVETFKGTNNLLEITTETLTRQLFSLLDIGKEYEGSHDIFMLASFAVYIHLSEKNNHSFIRSALIEYYLEQKLLDIFITDESLIEIKPEERDYFYKAFELLDNYKLYDAPAENLLAAIDQFLLFRNQQYAYKLPGWLTDFLIELSDLNDGDEVIDIFSNFGDVAVSAAKTNKRVSVVSVVNNPVTSAWAWIQQLIIDNSKVYNRVLTNYQPQTEPSFISFYKSIAQANKVIVAPPFNERLPFKYDFGNLSEDFYLTLAVELVKNGGRIVAILPDSFVSSKQPRRVQLRQYLFENMTFRAIFSLESFIPNTSVKSCILVLDKIPHDENVKILMGRVSRSEMINSLSNNNSEGMAIQTHKLAVALESLRDDDINIANAWPVHINKSNLDNLSVDFNDPLKPATPTTKYETVKLKDIAEMHKGSTTLTLDPRGDLIVIGPGAVRRMIIDPSQMGRTVETKLKGNSVKSEENDILINAVGIYRGQAAMVNANTANHYLNRNIIVVKLRSTSLSPAYLEVALNSAFVNYQMLEQTRGDVISQLTIGALEDILIPLPDKYTQQAIVNKVSKVREEIFSAQEKLQEHEYELNDILDQFLIDGGEQ